MKKDRCDQKDDHENERTRGLSDTEEADETKDGQVDTSRDLLQSTWIDQAFGVDLDIIDKKHIIPIGKI